MNPTNMNLTQYPQKTKKKGEIPKEVRAPPGKPQPEEPDEIRGPHLADRAPEVTVNQIKSNQI